MGVSGPHVTRIVDVGPRTTAKSAKKKRFAVGMFTAVYHERIGTQLPCVCFDRGPDSTQLVSVKGHFRILQHE